MKNTKTAEEFFENNKRTFTGVMAGDYLEKDYFIAYTDTLKKRIEELEAMILKIDRSEHDKIELVEFCKYLDAVGGLGFEIHGRARELIQKSEGNIKKDI